MSLIIALLVAGYLLLFAELLLPGMIAGIAGAICLVSAIVVAATVEGVPQNLWLYLLVGEIISGVILFWLWAKYFFKTSLGKRFVHDMSNEESSAPPEFKNYEGMKGVTVTPLRPSGTAEIEGKRVDVVTEGALIEKGINISVVKVEGARIVVRVIR
ncbi:MAG: NfeD family protein [Verrucomicrobiota bacterium]